MKKFLIVLSGIYLILVSGLAIFGLLTSLFYLLKASGQKITQLKLVVSFIFIMLLSLWPLIAGIGVMFRKNWARISVIFLSFLAIFIGIISLVSFFSAPAPQNTKVNYATVKAVFLWLNSIFLFVIPIFLALFYNNKNVKGTFLSQAKSEAVAGRPLGVTVIAVLAILGSLSSFFFLFSDVSYDVPLVGAIILSGNALKIYTIIIAFAYIYIGIGLLKLWKNAWFTYIALNAFYILSGLINIFTISEATISRMFSQFGEGKINVSLSSFKLFTAMGLIFPLVVAIYLISRKKYFFPVKEKSPA